MVLAAGSVLVLGLMVNVLAGALLAFTIFFYVVIYTMWLKRWTPQNIVIGGAAGAFPPMVGWAVGDGLDRPRRHRAVPHHLHLDAAALLGAGAVEEDNADYANAGVPMLPVVAGPDETRRQILLYTLLLVPGDAVPGPHRHGGRGSILLANIGLGAIFIWHAWRVYRIREGQEAEIACKKLFGFSTMWLFIVFALILAERALGMPSFAPVFG